MDISATISPLKTTSGFGKTGNSIGERCLTSNLTATLERYLVQGIAKTATNDARLACTRKPEVTRAQK